MEERQEFGGELECVEDEIYDEDFEMGVDRHERGLENFEMGVER